jgi:hypothetical protein
MRSRRSRRTFWASSKTYDTIGRAVEIPKIDTHVLRHGARAVRSPSLRQSRIAWRSLTRRATVRESRFGRSLDGIGPAEIECRRAAAR